jgi:hypothetical protein
MSFQNKNERDEIVTRIYTIDRLLYPKDGSPQPEQQESSRLKEMYYVALGEYADRLPRVRLSRCPLCGTDLKRVFDPWGLDGPWWHAGPTVRYEEPKTCEHFMVLLGALSMNGRIPVEAVDEVQPGPAVPFVVPALLHLPGMVAVVSKTALATGDIAYPIAYFSDQEIHPRSLQQSWCRTTHWFANAAGGQSWTIANYPFDYDLQPYLEAKQLRWFDLDDPEAGVKTLDAAETCPFLDLPGDRERQLIAFGERDLMGLPDGALINPFDD